MYIYIFKSYTEKLIRKVFKTINAHMYLHTFKSCIEIIRKIFKNINAHIYVHSFKSCIEKLIRKIFKKFNYTFVYSY